MEAITHPQLGIITPEPDRRCWWTQPIAFDVLGFAARICAFTRGEPPTALQLDAMVKSVAISAELKDEMAKEMADVYADIRPDYLGDTEQYGEIPEVREPDDIWPVLSELSVFVDDGSEIETCFSFRLGFDPDHEMNVTHKYGQIMHVCCEG